MKRLFKTLGIALLVILLLIVALAIWLLLHLKEQAKKQAADQAHMVKSDDELLGQHLYLPRDGQAPIDVNLYLPDTEGPHMAVFNLHGGAFVAGDADTLDTQSDRLCHDWDAVIISVNYTLAKDGFTIEYGTAEVADAVKYFLAHAEEYHIDPQKIVLMGYSAGGCHAVMAALSLQEEGIGLAAQVLCYPFIGDAVSAYAALPGESRQTLAPALFLLAGNDPISDGSLEYEEALRAQGVTTQVIKYEEALHGFIEENNPEYDILSSKASKFPEQERLARDAEQYIGQWLSEIIPVS